MGAEPTHQIDEASSLLSFAVFSLPASPITVWPSALPTLSWPAAFWPVESLLASSFSAADVSLDTGGGGPETDPVGSPAILSVSYLRISIVLNALGLWDAALSAMACV